VLCLTVKNTLQVVDLAATVKSMKNMAAEACLKMLEYCNFVVGRVVQVPVESMAAVASAVDRCLADQAPVVALPHSVRSIPGLPSFFKSLGANNAASG